MLNKNCTCNNTKCSRHGNCIECMNHHNSHTSNNLPHCKREGNKEASIKKKSFSHIIC